MERTRVKVLELVAPPKPDAKPFYHVAVYEGYDPRNHAPYLFKVYADKIDPPLGLRYRNSTAGLDTTIRAAIAKYNSRLTE
jgi:hypothetical protein